MSTDLAPFQLAYEASSRAIVDQASVLESLRSRAGTLFAATALVTSFLGGQADLSPLRAFSYTGLAIATFVAVAMLTLAILWPYRLRFSVSAASMLAIVAEREDEAPVTPREAYTELALRYEEMYDTNARTIRALLACFRLAIVFLVVEVAAWIVVLSRG